MITTNSVATIIRHPSFAFWSGASVSLIQFDAVAKVAVLLYLKVFYGILIKRECYEKPIYQIGSTEVHAKFTV